MTAGTRPRRVAARLGGRPGDVAVLAKRAGRRTVRQPAAWLPGILVPLVVAAVFTADYGRVAAMAGFPASASYLQYVLPATLLVGSVYAGIVAGTEATADVENRFICRLLLTPAWRPAIVTGVLSVAAVQAAVQSCAMLAIFAAFGAGIRGGAAGALAVVAAAVLFAVAVGGAAVALGLRTGDSEVMQSLFGLLLILLFVSSAFFPPADMHGWFRAVAEHSPLTTMADGMRAEVVSRHAGARAPAEAVAAAALLCAAAALLALGALRARGRSAS
jgi:ABC-2 type transport system permease protein